MLKIGIAGLRGLCTMPGFSRDESVEVTAFCDINDDILKEMSLKFNIPHTYRVYEDMLDSDIDAVVIATPMQFHAEQTIRALQARKHVLCEVTAAVNMDELWWIIEAVEESNMVYMLAENYCYLPMIQQVQGMVDKGLFGELYYGECGYIHNIMHMLNYNYGIQKSGKPSWRRCWQLGKRGAFYPTHSIGPMMKWFGGERIKAISSFGSGRHVSTDIRQEDTSITMIQLESGKLISLRTDCVSPRPLLVTGYSIQGTKGCFEAARSEKEIDKIWFIGMDDRIENASWHKLSEFDEYMPERFKNRTEVQIKNGWRGGGDDFMVDDFISSIVNKSKPYIDIYEACEWTAVGLLSELSIANCGRVMDMPGFRKNMPYEEQYVKI